MLRTKSILRQKEEIDGLRVSVMSRHTLNDGLTSHPKINNSCYDEWKKILAPLEKLVGDYYKRGLSWDEFEKRYLGYIEQENIAKEIKNLAKQSLDTTITLLCIEESPKYCHRRILAEKCKIYEPNLILNIE